MDVGTMAQYLTTVLGFSVLILGSTGAFIFILFKGLNLNDAKMIDDKPASYEEVAERYPQHH